MEKIKIEKLRIEEFIFGLNCNIVVHPPWDCLHRHDEIEMSFFYTTKKPVIFRIGSQIFSMDHNTTILFWAAIPHQIIAIEPWVKQFYITIPPHIFISWDLPDSLTNSILSGSIFIENDKYLRHIDVASFPIWKRESADSKNFQRQITLSRSFEARIRRFGGAAKPAIAPFAGRSILPVRSSHSTNKTFLRIINNIAQNYKNNIRVDDIAKEVDKHPNYVTSLFRKESGINISTYTLMLRIYEAQRLLLTTDMKIIDIAMEAGFESMSNFYKYFKKICGKNPKDYRKNVGI